MIDIKEVIKNIDLMKQNIINRNMKVNVDDVVAKYNAMVSNKQKLEELQREANEVANLIKKGAENKQDLIKRGSEIKSLTVELKEKDAVLEDEYKEQVMKLPNWMSKDVPVSDDEDGYKEIKKVGEPKIFNFKPLDHVQLGEKHKLIDFEAGAKVAGTKFYFLKNEAVLLQHAIKAFVFKKAIAAGFIPLTTPDVARNTILQGIGFAPRGDESNTYELADLDMSLVATAEIAVGGMHSDEVLNAEDLPLLYVAESHCFRREAGTAGRASKGLYRVHQFEKIELFGFTKPEQSELVHEKIREVEESIYQDLEIAYRVIINSSSDLGAPAYKKYDIEAWMPGKGEHGEYGEITSASNCTEYQARRLNIKFKEDGKNKFAHTLNGTASALGRTMLTIMENYQQADGSILIPKALRQYLDFEKIG
jgi:seryl-tRNA synthetase